MCEYWLFLFSIHWSIGCSGWRFLTETCHYRNSLFGTFLPSPMKGTNSWQWYTATHLTKSERLNSPRPPPHFAKFNLPQHRLALRSNKREAKGRSALKATLEEDGFKKKKRRRRSDAHISFFWTKESVVKMF